MSGDDLPEAFNPLRDSSHYGIPRSDHTLDWADGYNACLSAVTPLYVEMRDRVKELKAALYEESKLVASAAKAEVEVEALAAQLAEALREIASGAFCRGGDAGGAQVSSWVRKKCRAALAAYDERGAR